MGKSLLGSRTSRALFIAAALSANLIAFSAAEAAPSACRARAINYCKYEFQVGTPEYAACVYEQVQYECTIVIPDVQGPFCVWVGDETYELDLVCYNP